MGARTHPCFTPLLISNGSDVALSVIVDGSLHVVMEGGDHKNYSIVSGAADFIQQTEYS